MGKLTQSLISSVTILNTDEGSYLMYFEKVEKVALKDTQHVLRLTVSWCWWVMRSEVASWLVVLRFLLQLSLRSQQQ